MKKILIILVMLLLVTGCGKESKNSNNKEASLLVVAGNYNFKSGATYDGIAIFDDGTVYTKYLSTTKSDYNSSVGNYSINTKNGITKYYLEKGENKDNKVNKSDLNKIKKYIKNINEKNADYDCSGDDKIYSTITVFKGEERIELYTSNDCNSNNNISKLLEIVKGYKK